MRGVKGVFVCGKYHSANVNYSRKEVTKVMNKLKACHPQASLSVEELAEVVHMKSVPSDEDSSGGNVQ